MNPPPAVTLRGGGIAISVTGFESKPPDSASEEFGLPVICKEWAYPLPIRGAAGARSVATRYVGDEQH